MSEKPTLRTYQDGDGPALNDLYNRAFGAQRPYADWQWRFLDTPSRAPVVIALAEAGGQLVGQYASMSRDVSVDGRRVPFLFAQDTAIEEAYRKGISLFKGLTRTAVEFAKTQGGQFLGFGFPTLEHHKIGAKLLGYRDVAHCPQLFFRLNWFLAVRKYCPPLFDLLGPILRWPLALPFWWKLRQAAPPPTGCVIREVTSFDERVNELWVEAQRTHRIIPFRDAEFLNWHFRDKPGHHYRIYLAEIEGRIAGYLVTKTGRMSESQVGYISDFLCFDPAVFSALLQHALRKLVGRADYSLCLTIEGSTTHAWLLEQGFAERHYYRIPLVCEPLQPGSDAPEYQDGRNWFVTYADMADG